MGAKQLKQYEQIELNIDELSKKQKCIYDIHKNSDSKCWITAAQIDTNNTKNDAILPVYERYAQEVWGPYELRELQEKYLPVLTVKQMKTLEFQYIYSTL